jgi:hypothetical protein
MSLQENWFGETAGTQYPRGQSDPGEDGWWPWKKPDVEQAQLAAAQKFYQDAPVCFICPAKLLQGNGMERR